MERSYNGWTASRNPADFGGIVPLVVAGESFSPGVRAGDVADVLGYVAEQLNARVEPVYQPGWHEADDWGWSYRPNTNNPSQLSCHASGTAIDYNATRHPNGRGGTWTPAQRAEINKILAEVNGTVVNLVGYDEMHFEISGNAAQVAAAAARVRRRDVAKGIFMALTDEEQKEILEGARSVLFGISGKRSAGDMAVAVAAIKEALEIPPFVPGEGEQAQQVSLGWAALNTYLGMFYGGSSTPDGKSLMELLDEHRQKMDAVDAKLDQVLERLGNAAA